MDTSDLAKRMKDYEKRNRYYLQRRMPVILRLDSRAGHTFTRGFNRPFDEVFMESMQETAKYLCENIQNAKIAYVQSDEITIVLVDYDKLNTEPFFEYRVDKLCSISAGMATLHFNRVFKEKVSKFIHDNPDSKLCERYKQSEKMGLIFDCRAFNIPKEEVTNNLYWRQLDCSRNSIQMVGQANFSHKELQNKSCNMIQDMLMTQKGINWNDLPTYQKRGSCCVKMYQIGEGSWSSHAEDKLMPNGRTEWAIDTEIPVFKGENRDYIERLIHFD